MGFLLFPLISFSGELTQERDTVLYSSGCFMALYNHTSSEMKKIQTAFDQKMYRWDSSCGHNIHQPSKSAFASMLFHKILFPSVSIKFKHFPKVDITVIALFTF